MEGGEEGREGGRRGRDREYVQFYESNPIIAQTHQTSQPAIVAKEVKSTTK